MTNATRLRLAAVARWARPALAASALLVLGACGGDDGGDAVDTATSVTAFPTIPPITTTPATTPAPPTTVAPGVGPTFPTPPSTTIAGGGGGGTDTGGGTSAAGEYTVQANDCWSCIARKLGVDYQALLDVNGANADTLIVPGQKIKVPGGGSGGGDSTATTAAGGTGTTAAAGVAGQYTVQAGEWLALIAEKLGVDLQDLLDVNGFPSADTLIVPGQKIKVPTGGSDTTDG